MKALDLASSVPWAIRPESLEAILAIAAREDIPQDVVAAMMTSGSPEAVAARLGKPLDNTHAVSIRDGVAVIPVAGPIFRHANLFSEISGATTTDAIARDLTTALDNPSVRSILLEIDSPGGEVAGTAELAGMIRAAHERKPVTAYVDDLGASAAYWLASAAGEIVAAPTAVLGSIGVVAVMKDPAKKKSADLEFVSSKSPNKRPDLTTEAGKAQIQATVDALADVFFADVARYRGVPVETVQSDFGQGGVFVGQQAVDAGLADRVGSFEQTLRDLADPPAPAKPAPTPLRPNGPGRKTAMSMRDKFFAWLDGIETSGSADQEAAIVTDTLTTPPAMPATVAQAQTQAAALPVVDAESARKDAENAALRAEVQRLRTAAITQAASVFASEMIRDGRAMPAEQAAIIDAFTQASIDDQHIGAIALPDGRTTSRVEIVKRQYQDRQSVRALFSEAVGDDVLMALHNRQATPKKGDEAPSSDEVTKLIGMTAFGQSVIAGRNGATKN
jgi:signal peptide peptidase SppA